MLQYNCQKRITGDIDYKVAERKKAQQFLNGIVKNN